MTKILYQLQKGNMVQYTLSGLNIALASQFGEYKIQTTNIRPYYLSGTDIMYNNTVSIYTYNHIDNESYVTYAQEI